MMNTTRKGFICSSAAFAAAFGLDPKALAAMDTAHGFDSARYDALRKELRAFYPDDGQYRGPNQPNNVKDPRYLESYRAIEDELKAYVAANPAYDALDIRRELYRAMTKHAVAFLFRESPFYFELGVNGGWNGDRAAFLNQKYCSRFYEEQRLIPQSAFTLQQERWNGRLALCCGPLADDMHHIPPYHTVFTKGMRGVKAEIEAALEKCPASDKAGRKWLETALFGIDAYHEVQLKFAAEAERMLKTASGEEESRRLRRIAESASRCPWEAPRNFYEGLNTLWYVREIFGYMDGCQGFSIGRPDAWLEGFLAADLRSGELTTEEARDLCARFLLTAECHYDSHSLLASGNQQEIEIPLTLGGCDRDGKPVWNDITRWMLDAHIALDCVYPKLHCRISHESPKEYLEKIGAMLMKDHAVFALFNDDTHLPQFEKLGIATDRARDYVCTGCWDGNVDSESDVDCANYVSTMAPFLLAIYPDKEAERRMRLRIDPIENAKSFEELHRTVYGNFIRTFRDIACEYTRYGRVNAKVFPHPVYSAHLRGCLDRRRDTTDGGTFFRPKVITLAFLANLVDSLCAIRKIVFEDRSATLTEFFDAVRSNWRGERGEELRRLALVSPYWGDNTEKSNSIMKFWLDSVANDIDGMRNDQDGPYVLATWIYREFHNWGRATKASPDGRRDGDNLAQGFAPSEYRCKSNIADVFNALGTLPHERLYASNANLSFDKSGMSAGNFAAVFRVACGKRMHLLQPNCLSIDELLDARKHPERYEHLIVKVCGFSARFVHLAPHWQDEIINRYRLMQ